ncbi:4869_t:CDS:2 [Ambispora leptoticha]|uniref:4869_t:CDS:1 n=1 Tax=Ambispora leptoticha TaxID=144679 RepID=A0A9N8VNB5_9GLOM|nr:4869_t:CDS:2 [Ambispora leptoticha]
MVGVVGHVTAWATFGVAVRAFALMIQRRPLFLNPSTHALTAAAFASAGYYIYQIEQRQYEIIAQRRKELLDKRELRKTMEAKRKAYIEEHQLSTPIEHHI